jgi:hypothetical protein
MTTTAHHLITRILGTIDGDDGMGTAELLTAGVGAYTNKPDPDSRMGGLGGATGSTMTGRDGYAAYMAGTYYWLGQSQYGKLMGSSAQPNNPQPAGASTTNFNLYIDGDPIRVIAKPHREPVTDRRVRARAPMDPHDRIVRPPRALCQRVPARRAGAPGVSAARWGVARWRSCCSAPLAWTRKRSRSR